jgi:vitamin B12 transporter
MGDQRNHTRATATRTRVLVCALLVLAPTPAPAEEAKAEESRAQVIVVAPIDVRGKRARQSGGADLVGDDARAANAERALDEPAFVTVVNIDDRAGETASVAEVLARSMGVNVRSMGGLGGFSSISVRGAASGHTTVLVDGVPLSRVASVTTDLGRFELGSFSSLELYRGGVPAEFGGAGLGGVLNLVTRLGAAPDGKRWQLSAGGGSFAARHGRVQLTDGRRDGKSGYHLAASYAGANGNFPYFNDNGTNLNLDDDATVRRSNNGYDHGDVVARYRRVIGDLTVAAGSRSLWKQQGIPGSSSVQSESASLTTLSQLFDLVADKQRLFASPDVAGRGSAYFLLERQRYRDLDGEIGLAPQNRRYLALSGGGRSRVAWGVGEHHVLAAGAEAGVDYFSERDIGLVSDATQRSYGLRYALAMTLSDEIVLGASEALVFQPALRLDLMHTDPIDDSNSVVGTTELSPRTDFFPSPRLAWRGRLGAGVVVKGSAGWYFRAPTLTEMFGDRGFVVGNPGLTSETGLSADVGLVVAPSREHAGLDRLYLETALFTLRPRNVIVMVPTAGLVTVAQNLGDADIHGVEVGASVRIARTATVSANYTLLVSRQHSSLPSYDGKELPQRPRHQGYVRVDVARRLAGRVAVLWTDVTLAAGNFLDPGNVTRVPARRFLGAGIKLEIAADVVLGISAKNLTDERVEAIDLEPAPRPDLTSTPRAVADFFGYPLPGRALYLTAEWSH